MAAADDGLVSQRSSRRRPSRRKTKATLAASQPPLHLSVFLDDPSEIMLPPDLLNPLKSAILYADETELYCTQVQMTWFTQTLLDSPSTLLYNVARGHDLDDTRLSRGGIAGVWAIRRILLDHDSKLPNVGPGEAARRIDAIKRNIEEDEDENDSRASLAELQKVLGSGRVKLHDWVTTDPDLDGGPVNPYDIDWPGCLLQALDQPATSVLCDPEVANEIRSRAQLTYSTPAEERAGRARLGAGLIARLPDFPHATMDELIDIAGQSDTALSRYRKAVVELNTKFRHGPFDADYDVALADFWTTDVLPAITDIEDAYRDSGWLRYMKDRWEKYVSAGIVVTALATLPSLTVAAAPHLAFLSPEVLANVQSIAATGGKIFGAPLAPAVALAPALSAKTEARLSRREIERSDLFYLYETHRRLAR